MVAAKPMMNHLVRNKAIKGHMVTTKPIMSHVLRATQIMNHMLTTKPIISHTVKVKPIISSVQFLWKPFPSLSAETCDV
jgi:hypothetical protein